MDPIITLTTDFGLRDPYVASMKGVIKSICPQAHILDLTHTIGRQDLLEASLFVASSTPFFPQNTIHVVVVDPGVGTKRRPVIAFAANQFYVFPDNGLLSMLSKRFPIDEAREITETTFMREEISATFHGRDVFAPAAAHLAGGAGGRGLRHFRDVGKVVTDLVKLDVPQPSKEGNKLLGRIIHVDRFGNLITNIPRKVLGTATNLKVTAGKHNFTKISTTYGEAEKGKALTLIGSSDFLEIAVNHGNAAQELGLNRGDRVEVSA